MEIFLRIAYTTIWFLFFVLIIRRGYLDKTSPYSVGTILSVFTYNLVYALNFQPGFHVHEWLSTIMFCCGDGVIMVLFYKYMKRDFELHDKKYFTPIFAFVFLAIFASEWAFLLEMKTEIHPKERGVFLAVNYAMAIYYSFYSTSFIYNILKRRSIAAQSIYSAILKCLGSAVYLPLLIVAYHTVTPLMAVAFTYVTVTELAYVYLVYIQCKKENISVWKRI